MSGPMGASNFTTMFIVPVMGNVTVHIRAHRRNPMLTVSVVLCDLFGAICFLLNVFIIVTLIRNRRRVLTNVFYVIVLHCAVVDLIRGCCLIAWGMPHLLMNSMPTMQDRLLALKINQITLVILRSCNLLTIFNLLVFTTNEFIVIRYPLHYRRYFRRKAVLLILFVSWVISLTFGVGSVFSNFFESAHSIMVLNNGTMAFFRNGTGEERVTRRPAVLSINMISMLMIFILCYLCLFIVLICYGFILRTIRQFHAVDVKGSHFRSEDSQRISTLQQRTKQQKEAERREDEHRRESSLLSSVDPNKCNSHRRWRMHLMSRHKYLIVIGSVLFVDILFLFPYSGIQMVAFLHLNNLLTTSHRSTLIRWGLQILIGVHSVCQPLCYFRMTEFRRLACCCKTLQRNRSRSFTQMPKSGGATKEIQKDEDEMVGLRSAADSPQPADPLIEHCKEAKRSVVHVNGFVPKLNMTSSCSAWRRAHSVRFRTYGSSNGQLSCVRKISDLTGLRSNPNSDSQSMVLTNFAIDNYQQQNGDIQSQACEYR
ncbi:Beta-2 adrenergic receptor [Toxocara canis]|uniref:Beta-2 adrenergic receptor n=1 Tax=Toxocara canis TaxID=6265 RepID=A0A0B2UWM9_TOXCA|nr:Beta-2 adrenergic receptor [Toxocara canis]